MEVVLALALSTLVISAIAAAIRLHLLMLDRQQADIERSQVARAVLHMIANDLRSAIQYKPADVSALEELAASQAAMLSALGGSPAPSSESTGEAGDDYVEGGLDGVADVLYGGLGADRFKAEYYTPDGGGAPVNRDPPRDFNAAQGDVVV